LRIDRRLLFRAFDRGDIRYDEPHVYYVHELPFCPRRAFFFRVFNARPIKHELMVLGSIFHASLPQIAKEMEREGMLRSFEVEKPVEVFHNGITIRGHIDVFGTLADGRKAVLEFKFTEGPDLSLRNELHAAYAIQANTYACMAGADVYYLVLVSRHSLDVEAHEFEPDEEAYKRVLQKAREIDKCVQDMKIPYGPEYEWECASKRFECQFCIICDKIGRQRKI